MSVSGGEKMLHTHRNDLGTGIKLFISNTAGRTGKQCLKITEGKILGFQKLFLSHAPSKDNMKTY